ncbi:hypothetical protein, partial [Shewanella algae]|uniref:hypothetical protein n=2 Tax=Shewanella algae TaxID=38313 RepID=UPI001C57C6F2
MLFFIPSFSYRITRYWLTKASRLSLTPWDIPSGHSFWQLSSGKNLPGEQKIARVWARNCPESGGWFVYCCKTVVYDLACFWHWVMRFYHSFN